MGVRFGTPKGSKNRAQEASKTPLKPGSAPRGSRDRFWVVFGTPRDLKNMISREMVVKIKVFVFGRRTAKQSPKRPQNEPKIGPKTAPRGPKCGSEALLDFRFNFSTDFKHFWVPKGLPKGTQNRSKIALRAPGPPKGLQGSPRRPPGSHFCLILGPRELIFEPFKRPFRSLRAPHHTIENTVRNHFPKDPLRPLRDRCAKHRRLSGRFGAAGPLEIRPLSLQAQEGAVERSEMKFPKAL